MVASNCWTTLRRFWPGHRTPTPSTPDKHRIGQRNLDRSHGPFDVPTSDGHPIGDSLRPPAMVSTAEKHAHNDPGGRPLSALAKRPQTPGRGLLPTAVNARRANSSERARTTHLQRRPPGATAAQVSTDRRIRGHADQHGGRQNARAADGKRAVAVVPAGLSGDGAGGAGGAMRMTRLARPAT